MSHLITDKLGQEIQAGDYIVFRLSGRSGDIHYGKVMRIDVVKDEFGVPLLDRNGDLQPIVYTRQVLDKKWLSPTKTIAKKDSRLSNTDGMVIYPTMPQEIKDLFTQAGL